MNITKEFFKLVCVDVSPFEYAVHVDINRHTLDEVHEFIDKHIKDHPGAEWKLIPMSVQLNM